MKKLKKKERYSLKLGIDSLKCSKLSKITTFKRFKMLLSKLLTLKITLIRLKEENIFLAFGKIIAMTKIDTV